MSTEDQQDGRALILILVEEYGGKHDDGAVAMAIQDTVAFNAYTGAGPF